MESSLSKPIQKTDDSAKQLIIEALEGQNTGGFDLDSVYNVRGTYYVLEFLKCDTVRPFNSHPRRYWFKNKQKFLSLWDITKKLEGRLYLVNYEDSREQFKVIRVLELNEHGIQREIVKLWNFDQFKVWFKALNNLTVDKEEAIEKAELGDSEDCSTTYRILDCVPEADRFTTYLPLYTIRAACGYFGEGEQVEDEGWIKANGIGKLSKGMYVVRAVGHSMEPRIHDGDYCVFQANPAGSRQGTIVLAQHRGYFDEDNAGAFSIKEYHSTKSYDEYGSWQHEKIVLKPFNRDYNPIELTPEDIDTFRIIGGFVGIIKPEEPHDEPMICPNCGGQLVERKGTNGAFYGCSNYPKCHYMQKK